MYRSQPVGNKLCYDKAVKRNKNKHKQALNQIKSSIDCRPPTSHKLYLNRRNLKKEYMKKERFLEIDRDGKVHEKDVLKFFLGGAAQSYERRRNFASRSPMHAKLDHFIQYILDVEISNY